MAVVVIALFLQAPGAITLPVPARMVTNTKPPEVVQYAISGSMWPTEKSRSVTWATGR